MPGTPAPRRVTAADVARAVGVSRATVGFVLNNTPGQTISEATRARVLGAAARMGYRPHRAATALAGGRSRIVLLVLPDWPAEFSMRMYLEEAARALDEANYSLVTQTQTAERTARPLWESLNPDVVIGWSPFSAEDVASMHAAGIARILPSPDEPVTLDRAPGVTEGTRLQIGHLYDLGHRRIAYAAAADTRIADLVRARTSAAAAEAEARGIRLHDVRSIDPAAPSLADCPGSAGQFVRAWRADGVTAIAAYNDDVAAAVAGAALRTGLRVPEDLAVVGHDDSPLASLFVPSLSSVRMDAVRAGRYLAALALQEAEARPVAAGVDEMVTCLVARESTGAGLGDTGAVPTGGGATVRARDAQGSRPKGA
ncbi:LacI family transcriptional regulator [Streptomycetaceae bacterium NBC_01309]